MYEPKLISPKVKLEILYRIWGGERITHIAHDCGVSRQVIYIWKKRAEGALLRALKAKRRGPKVQNIAKNQAASYDQGKHETLLGEKVSTKRSNSLPTSKVSQSNNKMKMPERCPICGCEKIYKNGTYARQVSSDGHKRIDKAKKTQIIQRYICVWCKHSVS